MRGEAQNLLPQLSGFVTGDKVEVWSVTQSTWLPGVVEARCAAVFFPGPKVQFSFLAMR